MAQVGAAVGESEIATIICFDKKDRFMQSLACEVNPFLVGEQSSRLAELHPDLLFVLKAPQVWVEVFCLANTQ